MCAYAYACGSWCRAKQEWYQLFIIEIALAEMLDIFTLENRKIFPLYCEEPYSFLPCTIFCRSAQAAPQLTLWAWECQWNLHRDCCIYPAASSAYCPSGAGIDPPSRVLLRDPAPKMSNWLWRKQKRESECGKQRAVLGSAWIWNDDQKKS